MVNRVTDVPWHEIKAAIWPIWKLIESGAPRTRWRAGAQPFHTGMTQAAGGPTDLGHRRYCGNPTILFCGPPLLLPPGRKQGQRGESRNQGQS
jgi:hypothetical protein